MTIHFSGSIQSTFLFCLVTLSLQRTKRTRQEDIRQTMQVVWDREVRRWEGAETDGSVWRALNEYNQQEKQLEECVFSERHSEGLLRKTSQSIFEVFEGRNSHQHLNLMMLHVHFYTEALVLFVLAGWADRRAEGQTPCRGWRVEQQPSEKYCLPVSPLEKSWNNAVICLLEERGERTNKYIAK